MKLRFNVNTKTNDVNVALYNKSFDKAQESHTIPYENYITNLSNDSVILENSILPPAVRYLDLNKGIVLFERPPCYIAINLSMVAQHDLKADGKSQLSCVLPIPWQRYVLWLAPNGLPIKIYLFFANAQLKSLDDDTLSYVPLPNFYDDASMCLPVFDHIDVERFDLLSAISNAYNIVWRSGFNMDIIKGYQVWMQRCLAVENPLISPVLGNRLDSFYTHWANYSLEEIVKFNWLSPAYTSFNSLVENKIYPSIDYHERVVNLFLAARG